MIVRLNMRKGMSPWCVLLFAVLLTTVASCCNPMHEENKKAIEAIKSAPDRDRNAKGRDLAEFIKIGDSFDHVKTILGPTPDVDGYGPGHFDAYYREFNLRVSFDDKKTVTRISQP